MNDAPQPMWNLSTWASDLPRIVAVNRERWPQQCSFFESAVQALRDAPFIPPDSWIDPQISRNAREVDAAAGLPPAAFPSPEWRQRHWPSNGAPSDNRNAHLIGVHLAAGAVLRSMARCGFFAAAGLESDSLSLHRRTREALVHLELLLDDASLAGPYFDHILEVKTSVRKANRFFLSAANVFAAIGNPQFPKEKHTPLRRALAAEASLGYLNAGPHAGAFHGVMGFGSGAYDFFDTTGRIGPWYGLKFTADTVAFVDCLMPKLPWITQASWSEVVARLRAMASDAAADPPNLQIAP